MRIVAGIVVAGIIAIVFPDRSPNGDQIEARPKFLEQNISPEGGAKHPGLKRPALMVGQIIDQAFVAADDLVTEGFNRFDRSVLLAATEARATVNQASLQLADSINLSVEKLDSQQRRVILDLESLTATINEEIASDVADIVVPIQYNIQLLLSQNPGFIRISGGFATRQDDYLEFQLQGTALSQADIVNFQVNSVKSEPIVVSSDDTRVTIRIPLDEPPIADLLGSGDSFDELIEIPISFVLKECGLFGMFCNYDRKFSLLGYVFPENVGTVRAVFVGEISTKEWRPREQEFISDRVQTNSIGTEAGDQRDIWVMTPDDGWRIDTSSAHFDFVQLHREGCSNSRCSASWVEKGEHILRVRARTSSIRQSGRTCRTSTTIRFSQWRTNTNRHTHETDAVEIVVDGITHLPLDKTIGLTNARLSRLVIQSPLFRRGERRLLDGGKIGGLRVEYNAETQTAFLHSSMN